MRKYLIIGIIILIIVILYFSCKYPFVVREVKDRAKRVLLSVTTAKANEILQEKPFIRSFTGMKNSFPWVAGIVVEFKGKEMIFLGGGENQDDVLLDYQNGKLVNIIEGTGLSSKSPTYGGVSIDMDGDGLTDLIVARQNGVFLYKNKGNMKFEKIQIVKEEADRVPVAISVTDIDKDGNLDIYVSNFIQSKDLKSYQFNNPEHSKSNILLQGLGDNKFDNITEKSGTKGRGNTFTSAFIDLNKDTLPDLILSQDAGEVEIYENKGKGIFERKKVDSGFGFWMGIAQGDIDNDGDIDLFLTNVSNYIPEDSDITSGTQETGIRKGQKLNHSHIILRNDGDFKFTDITNKHMKSPYGFGWGGVFEDLNLDTKLDLLFSVNYMMNPISKFIRNPHPVLINKDGKFQQDYRYSNFGYGHTPLLADLDKDGYKDIIWINIKGPVKVYSGKNWEENNYIQVKLPSNSEFVNAKIELITDRGKVFMKENVQGGIGFGSDQSEVHTFGLGKNYIPKAIRVTTIYGKVYEKTNVKVNSTVSLLK